MKKTPNTFLCITAITLIVFIPKRYLYIHGLIVQSLTNSGVICCAGSSHFIGASAGKYINLVIQFSNHLMILFSVSHIWILKSFPFNFICAKQKKNMRDSFILLFYFSDNVRGYPPTFLETRSLLV